MDEREVKLAVPPGFRLPDPEAFPDGVTALPQPERRLHSLYYDTPDLRLARWGCSLRHRSDDGWTVKLPSDHRGSVLVRREHSFPGKPSSPPAAALDLVRAYLRTATVQPVARLRTVRRPVLLIGPTGETFGELVDDEVSVLEGRRLAARFRELELELGGEAEDGGLLDIVLDRLREAGAGAPDPTPKVVRALGPRSRERPEVFAQEAEPGQSLEASLRQAIVSSTIRLIRHDAGVRLGDDSEDVHQARVAARRLRSDLRTFRSVIDAEWTASMREELRWIGAALGAVRDAEVLLERLRTRSLRLRDAAGVGTLLEGLGTERERARQELLAAVRDPRYVALLDRLVDAVAGPLPLQPDAALPAAQALPAVVATPWNHLRSAAAGLGDPPADQELHELRIRTKRVRYAAEAAAPVLGKKALSFAGAAARLQGVLGEHQDSVVAYGWLRGRATRARGVLAFAAGELAGMEQMAALDARAAWPKAWKAVVKRWPRAWS